MLTIPVPPSQRTEPMRGDRQGEASRFTGTREGRRDRATKAKARNAYGTDTGPLGTTRSFQSCAAVPARLRLPAT